MNSKSKNIYWFYPHFKFWMGGTKFLLDIGERINKENRYNISFVTNLGNKEFINKFTSTGIPVFNTSFLCTNDSLYWIFFPIFFIWDLIASGLLVYKNNPDILMATLFPSNAIAAILGLLFRKKYIFYCYEPYPFFHDKKYIQKQTPLKKIYMLILSRLYGEFDNWASKKASKILTIDSFKASLIKKQYEIAPIITGVGVNTDRFIKQIRNNKYALQFQEKPLVIHSTDYTPMKGTEFAVKAMVEVVKKLPECLLLITSTQPDSPLKKKYLDLAKSLGLENNIIHLGLISEQDMPYLYSSGVCYLSTSNDKMTAGNWPVKESLACQTPAIRSKIATLDVEDGLSGFLLEPNESQKIAEKIVYLVNHPEAQKKMGMYGRNTILKNYSWDTVIGVITKEIS